MPFLGVVGVDGVEDEVVAEVEAGEAASGGGSLLAHVPPGEVGDGEDAELAGAGDLDGPLSVGGEEDVVFLGADVPGAAGGEWRGEAVDQESGVAGPVDEAGGFGGLSAS